jgi:ribosomal-protein-alanine N-acetyltransferase
MPPSAPEAVRMTATLGQGFARPSRDRRVPVEIRVMHAQDAYALTNLHVANRDYLRPWEPERGEGYFTLAGQRQNVQELLSAYYAGELWPGVIIVGGRIVGRLTLNNILRGPLLSCFVGYWVARSHAGRGIATEALRQALDIAFRDLSLHRVEAYTRLDNHASQRVLLRNGFTRVGVARRHVHVDGRWHDQVLYERLAPWDDGVTLRPGPS